jgi:hypothetical protein
MTTITEVRALLRRDLADLDSAAYRWTDTDLDRHITHTLNDLSDAVPRELRSTLQATATSREISVATLKPRRAVLAVEYPTGQYPPAYAQFSLWADTLTLLTDTPPSAADDVNVLWLGSHVLDDSGSTLDPPLLDILLLGATAYAADQLVSGNTEAIWGADVDKAYAALATRKMRAFRSALKLRGPRASLRTSSLYTPAEPAPTQDTDPGP